MVTNKNKSSVLVVKKVVTKKDGSKVQRIVGYLSNRDVERGEDMRLDLNGYIIEAI